MTVNCPTSFLNADSNQRVFDIDLIGGFEFKVDIDDVVAWANPNANGGFELAVLTTARTTGHGANPVVRISGSNRDLHGEVLLMDLPERGFRPVGGAAAVIPLASLEVVGNGNFDEIDNIVEVVRQDRETAWL